MLFISGKNNLKKWKKLYIFQAYTMPFFRYGSSKYYITSGNIGSMRKNVQFKKYVGMFKSILKHTLNLPARGNPKPMMDFFFQISPETIVISNYL